MDFRRRALLQHYWVTRDLTAIARFGGYKRPESALNLISEILSDQGVDSIDKLATLPEFEALKGDRKRLASVGEADQLTITIQLDRDEMDIIRNSGLTPTQAVKTIISLKDLYGAFSPRGTPSAVSAAPTGGGPSPPSLGGEGPVISTPSSSSGPAPPPNLNAAPPSLDKAPAGPPLLDNAPGLKPIPKGPGSSPDGQKRPPGGVPPGELGGQMSQLNELKQILAARRARMAKQMEEEEAKEKEEEPKTSGLGGTIRDVEPQDKDLEDDEDEDIPDIPDLGM